MKCVNICCITHARPEYFLRVGPMNDALAIADYFKQLGFDLYFNHNTTSEEFICYLHHFVKNTKKYLVVYNTGHGWSIKKTDGMYETITIENAPLFKIINSERN